MPLQRLVYDTVYGVGFENVTVGVAHDCHLAALHAVRRELEMPAPPLAVYLGGLRDVGGAVILDGEIFAGADGAAGDFGHANIDPGGPLCSCGRRGCLGSLIDLERLLVRAGLAAPEEAEQLVTHQPSEALRQLVAAAAAGDEAVLGVLAEAGTTLGVAVDDVIGTLNPDLVVLGGYLGVLRPYLLDSLQDRIAVRLAVEPFAGTTLVALDATSRVVGGAALAARDACLYDPLNLTQVL
jgi:predicted NBD/HSP70 family sugar kinase